MATERDAGHTSHLKMDKKKGMHAHCEARGQLSEGEREAGKPS